MSAPKVSVVLVAATWREGAQRTLDALAAQSAAGSIEVVVADLAQPGTTPLGLPHDVPTTVIPCSGRSWAEARAEAVRQARGEVVAFIEDHCIPARDWAEVLIEAHRGPWAGVGYAFASATPEHRLARSALIADYGAWAHPTRPGPVRHLPRNNVSYKRDALLSVDGPLEARLEVALTLHQQLLERGMALYVEPRVLVAHENLASLAVACRASFAFCRLLAAERVRSGAWGWPRRIVWGLATPLGAPSLTSVGSPPGGARATLAGRTSSRVFR